MEIFSGIVEYLEDRNLVKSAKMLQELIKTISFDSTMSSNELEILKKIQSALPNKENKPSINPENEAMMENLMTKLISNPSVALSKTVETRLDKLLQIKAFNKMISCADQLFFENESMNMSSKIIHQSDKEESYADSDLPSMSDESSLQSSRPHLSAKLQDDDKNENGEENEDEYEEEDDPGYDAYECSEEDFAQVSKKLASKYGFPERAVYPKKSEHNDRNNEETKPFFPDYIKFPKSVDGFYPKEFDGTVHDAFVLKVISDRNSTGFEEIKEFPIVMNSIVAGRYKIIEFLGSAAFSKAVQAIDLFTDEMVCLKIIENNKDYVDQSIDEIKLLLYIKENGDLDSHNLLKVIDFFYHKEHLFIVTELLRDNLYEFYKYNREQEEEFYFTMGHLQRIAYQILQGLQYLHKLKLIHCDLKPENILIKSYSRCLVKIIDLGSSCYIHDHLSSYVQSRSYRAPEVILGCSYDYRIDIWSLGCILSELWTGNVLFQNECIQGLLSRVIGIIGPFPDYMLKHGRHAGNFFTKEKLIYQVVPGKSDEPGGNKKKLVILVPKRTSLKARLKCDDEDFVHFIKCLLELDKEKRPNATEAMKHPWLSKKYPDGLSETHADVPKPLNNSKKSK
jgi:serine/threonine protein kinase